MTWRSNFLVTVTRLKDTLIEEWLDKQLLVTAYELTASTFAVSKALPVCYKSRQSILEQYM
jgi:hypothetical protein